MGAAAHQRLIVAEPRFGHGFLRPFIIAVLIFALLLLGRFLQELFIAHYSGAQYEDGKEPSWALIWISILLCFAPALGLIPAIGNPPLWVFSLALIALIPAIWRVVPGP